MNNIATLRPVERITQDGKAIAEIYRSLGAPTAERIISHAMEELGLLLNELAVKLRDGQKDEFVKQLNKMDQLAENLGMTSFCKIIDDARSCIENGNDAGFAAVWARLIRVAELSITTKGGSSDHLTR